MKKILLSLFAVLMTVGAWAEQTPVLTYENITAPMDITSDAAAIRGMSGMTFVADVTITNSSDAQLLFAAVADYTSSSTDNNTVWGLGLGGNSLRYIVGARNGGWYSSTSGTLTTAAKKIVFTYDGTNIKYYVDGENIKTQGSTKELSTFAGENARFYLGGVVYNTNTEWGKFSGTISKVEIYNTVLTDREVLLMSHTEDELVTEWKTATLATIGKVGGYSESVREEIEAVATLDGIDEFEETHEVLTISTDAYYRLICVAPKTGNNGDNSYNTLTFNGSSNLVTAPTSNSNINQIFKFEDAGDGKYYLKNLCANAYLNKIAAGSYRSQVVAQNDACKVELQSYGAAQWEVHNSESNDTKHSLFAENHPKEAVPYACAGWDGGANSASAWYIVPVVEVEVGINGFASIYLPFAVETDEAKMYAIESVNATSAILTEKTGIPAAQGAILAGNGTATLSIVDEVSSDWSGNLLKGTSVNTYVEGDAYVLSNKNGIGLYKADLNKNAAGETGTTHFLNNAGKAYLPASAVTGNARFLSLDFGTETAIESVESVENNAAVYDLSGRRVQKAQKGLYIVNGKKVVK